MTPREFRAKHGDPQFWVGVEIDEYLTACDGTEAVYTRLRSMSDYITANPTATSQQVIAAYKGGAR